MKFIELGKGFGVVLTDKISKYLNMKQLYESAEQLCLQIDDEKIPFFFTIPVPVQGGAHDLAKFRVPMIHRFMTSHPVEELLLCFRPKQQDGRPMLFGFLVIFTHRLTELCILNAENIKKVYSRPFKQMS